MKKADKEKFLKDAATVLLFGKKKFKDVYEVHVQTGNMGMINVFIEYKQKQIGDYEEWRENTIHIQCRCREWQNAVISALRGNNE